MYEEGPVVQCHLFPATMPHTHETGSNLKGRCTHCPEGRNFWFCDVEELDLLWFSLQN